MGLSADLLSVFAFHWSGFDFIHAHSHGGSPVGHSHNNGEGDHDTGGNANMLSAFVHVLSDMCSSVLMVVAGFLIYFKATPGVITDAICSLVVSVRYFLMFVFVNVNDCECLMPIMIHRQFSF